MIEDVTDRKLSEERIAHLAHYDALTDLPNRLFFREQLEHALKRVRRGEQLAVLYLDLDKFKGVNDTLGHQGGDELLKAVARAHCAESVCAKPTLSLQGLAATNLPLFRPRWCACPMSPIW